MTRMPTLAGALSLAVMTATTGAAAYAAAPAAQNAPSEGLALQEQYGRTLPWHYEWQYHYSRHGEWVPGWVAVLNNH